MLEDGKGGMMLAPPRSILGLGCDPTNGKERGRGSSVSMVMAVRADLFRSAYEIMHEPKEIKRIKGGGRAWADREKGTIGGRWLGHDLTDVKTK